MSQQERLPYFDPSREEVEKLVEACKANDGLSMGLPWFSLNGHAVFEFSVQDGLGGLRLAHLPKLSGWVTSGQFGCRIWLLSFLMMLLCCQLWFLLDFQGCFCVATECFGVDDVDNVLLGIEPFLAHPPAVLGAIILGPL